MMKLKVGNKIYTTKTSCPKPRLVVGNEYLELTTDKNKTRDGEKLFVENNGTRMWVREKFTKKLTVGYSLLQTPISSYLFLGAYLEKGIGSIEQDSEDSSDYVSRIGVALDENDNVCDFCLSVSGDKGEVIPSFVCNEISLNWEKEGVVVTMDSFEENSPKGFVSKTFTKATEKEKVKNILAGVNNGGDFILTVTPKQQTHNKFDIIDSKIANKRMIGGLDLIAYSFEKHSGVPVYWGAPEIKLSFNQKVSNEDFLFLTSGVGIDKTNTIKLEYKGIVNGLHIYSRKVESYRSSIESLFMFNNLYYLFEDTKEQSFLINFETTESTPRMYVFEKDGTYNLGSTLEKKHLRDDGKPSNIYIQPGFLVGASGCKMEFWKILEGIRLPRVVYCYLKNTTGTNELFVLEDESRNLYLSENTFGDASTWFNSQLLNKPNGEEVCFVY
ncbi:MAG: hypothetical protein ACRCZ2_01445 [Fusobacteriaceae bacterium]